MGRKKKHTGIMGVSFSNRGRRGRGKKGLDRWSNMGGMGEKAFKNATRRGRGSSRLDGIRDWFSKTEYLDERRRITDEMETNPEAIAREIRANRVMQLPGKSFMNSVINTITRAAMRVQRRETTMKDDKK